MKSNKEEKRLDKLARDVLDFLGYKNSVVEINLITGRQMRPLNRRFKGKDSTTNVLSFPIPKEFPQIPGKNLSRPLGEIYLDGNYIRKHNEDIDYLLIHGLLHLLGFNHKRYDDRMKMERLEKKILEWQKTKS